MLETLRVELQMRYCTALSLAILIGASSAPAIDRLNSPATRSLGLLLRSDAVIAPGILDAMEHEVQSAFAGASVDLRFEGPEQATGMYSRIAVLKFQGACSVDPLSGGAVDRAHQELGTTHIVEGAIIPFADIECSAVRQTLGAAAGRTRLTEAVLGRALGRVVAHELYHILLKDARHGRGLAAAAFTPADLIASRRSFDAADLNRIAASFRESAAAPTPAPRRMGASPATLSFLSLR